MHVYIYVHVEARGGLDVSLSHFSSCGATPVHLEVRGQCRSWASNSGHKNWHQEPLPATPRFKKVWFRVYPKG